MAHQKPITQGQQFASDEEKWTAVQLRDSRADGSFVYAVATTGIFCRPSCGSRKPRRENVEFYATSHDALQAGFRACKRCRPDSFSIESRNAQIVAAACRMIESSDPVPSLKMLAQAAGLSTHYFHRLFRSVTGITPRDFAGALRDKRMAQELRENPSVTRAMYSAGFSSSSRFYSRANVTLGMTPTSFRSGGRGETIRFALGECTLGSISVAATDVGVCSISLGDNPGVLLRELQDRFPKALLVGGDEAFEKHVAAVVGFVASPSIPLEMPLDIRGTAFQRRVWKALQKTIPGETLTYSELAIRLSMPNAARAVASACASNLIALAIPCHRVIRADGALSGYRWGIDRKRELLLREQIAS